ATTLELTASTPDGKAILQGDLRWCPTFTELKTLILNEWCLYDDVTALACLLRHTPALESLQLDFKRYTPGENKRKLYHIKRVISYA
uniref:FBD domain-containing protein n=1 Tax=Aegilops tauschii subsp. strangulata TaxID=200361 RepID=A0A452Z6I8_AEGTS